MDFFIANEGVIRLVVFLAVFALMAMWELASPRRALVVSKVRRWWVNWALTVLDAAVIRVLFPLVAVGAAWDAQQKGWGLFNAVAWPGWVEALLAILILDCLIYWQHVASHRIPILWRVHRVHHSDRDIDVTTAIRFHPVEIALSMGLKIGAVYVLGASAAAVVIFEVLLNACAMFNHSNIRLGAADRLVRLALVTPDMHRVHHSIVRRETDANFGFNVPWWDRLFGTYVAQPEAGHDAMTIGLPSQQNEGPTRLGWALSYPLKPARGDD